MQHLHAHTLDTANIVSRSNRYQTARVALSPHANFLGVKGLSEWKQYVLNSNCKYKEMSNLWESRDNRNRIRGFFYKDSETLDAHGFHQRC